MSETTLCAFTPNIKLVSFLPLFSQNIGYLILFLGIILFGFGVLLINSLIYKKNARCKKCNHEYAYRPSKNPGVKDVETREGTRRTIKKFY